MTPMTTRPVSAVAGAPRLETDRLILRQHVMADLEPLYTLFASDRARFMGGPFSRKQTFYWVAGEVGSWDLMGHGSWGVETKTGTFVGQVGVNQPPHFPEPEIGWVFLPEAEGKGYAQEAALAVLDWVRDVLRPDTLVSYIHVDNARSIALAERLGAVPDPDAPMAEGDTPDDTRVYRHLLDADGGPEAYA